MAHSPSARALVAPTGRCDQRFNSAPIRRASSSDRLRTTQSCESVHRKSRGKKGLSGTKFIGKCPVTKLSLADIPRYAGRHTLRVVWLGDETARPVSTSSSFCRPYGRGSPGAPEAGAPQARRGEPGGLLQGRPGRWPVRRGGRTDRGDGGIRERQGTDPEHVRSGRVLRRNRPPGWQGTHGDRHGARTVRADLPGTLRVPAVSPAAARGGGAHDRLPVRAPETHHDPGRGFRPSWAFPRGWQSNWPC